MKIFELVTATVRLHKAEEFHRLHRTVLLPILEQHGVKPVFLSETYTGGEIGRFYDIYEYPDLAEYQRITALVEQDPGLPGYYELIEQCILGTISITLLRAVDYSPTQ
jgi:NIPSNAP